MILIILQLTIPLLGIYTLNQIFNQKFDKKTLVKGLKIAIGITGGICAVFALIPGLAGNFTAPVDQQYYDWLRALVIQDRISMLRADAFRSLIFILLAGTVIWAGVIQKLKFSQMAIILSLLILTDMWTIDKRYLNNSHFVTQKEFNNQFRARPVDLEILKDNDPNYRVLDLAVNVFNDSHSSYFHKTIGGYSAAKLQRYQDIIDYFIIPEIQSFQKDANATQTLTGMEESLKRQKVLNMLNTKYIILNTNASIENRSALGNAWFVQDYKLVNTPKEELVTLQAIDPAEIAVINEEFKPIIQDKGFNYDENGEIVLTEYAPNRLEYKSKANNEQLALFSEVYYPKGWKAYIDGEETDLFRANYILRGMIIPAGEHTIVFEYKPESYYTGAKISAICSGILLLLLLGYIIVGIKKILISPKTTMN